MTNSKSNQYRINLMLCAGTACVSTRAFEIKEVLEQELKKHKLDNEIEVVTTGCNGFCEVGPVMTVMPDGIFYHSLKSEDIPYLVEEHFLKGRPVKKFMYTPPDEKDSIPKLMDIAFFSNQTLIALRNRGLINPEKIDEYIARDGYKGLAKALTEMKPEEIINVISDSGLRGRGGGGFSTGRKWNSAAKVDDFPKYVICNADEGDPGAYMDRSLVEADPHVILEGMMIAGRAIGSSEGYVYIRHEYPLATKRLEIAIEQAKQYGLVGENIFGTDFSFNFYITQGAGAFVCGESSALRASIEGTKVPEPVSKQIHATEKGLWEKPTVLNNVETFANIPIIINKGAKWYSSIGTENSKGTKVFSITGNINNAGLVEVPMGISLRKIIFDIGGGIPGNKKFKAVQTGGPSGGCIPAKLLDLPVDFEKLTEVGSIMGSGGMIIMDEDTCMVDVAKYFIEFSNDESCGKCTSCRDGSTALLDILTRICNGEGEEADIELLEDLSYAIKDASLCGLGQSLSNPVLSILKYFKEEFKAHIIDKTCPAKVCKPLFKFSILKDKCTGCTLCARSCPQNCISGEKKEPHEIDQSKCIKCGICFESCNFDAIIKE